MNFRNMPELEWEHGYILAWGVMIVIGFVTYLFFRTKSGVEVRSRCFWRTMREIPGF